MSVLPSGRQNERLAAAAAVMVFALVSAGIARWIAVYGLHGVPHVMDEITYMLQAKTLASGHVSSPVALPRAAFNMWFVEDRAARFGIFPPGWPLVLAIGVKLGIPGAVNPILHALTIWWIGRSGRLLSGEKLQLLAAGLYAASPQAILLAASFMSHTVVAACGALVLLTSIKMIEKRAARWAFLAAGVALGLTAATRPLCACALLVTFVIACVLTRPSLRALAWALPPLALSVVLLGIYNGLLTGSAVRFPQSYYFDEHLPPANLRGFHYHPGCNDLGFGESHGCDSSIRGGFHTFGNALSNSGDNLTEWYLLACGGWPLVLALVAAAYTAVRDARLRRAVILCFTAVASVILLYALYWYAGTCFGGRFYHAAFPALMLAVAIGALRVPRRDVLAAVLLLIVGWNAYALRGSVRELPNYWGTDDRFVHVREGWSHGPAIVMVAFEEPAVRITPLHWTSHNITSGFWHNNIRALGALGQNTPTIDGPIVFAKFHPGLVDPLRERFPGRELWLYVVHVDSKNDTLERFDPEKIPEEARRSPPPDNFDSFVISHERPAGSGAAQEKDFDPDSAW